MERRQGFGRKLATEQEIEETAKRQKDTIQMCGSNISGYRVTFSTLRSITVNGRHTAGFPVFAAHAAQVARFSGSSRAFARPGHRRQHGYIHTDQPAHFA